MFFQIKKIQLRYKEHRTLIIGEYKPNWFERVVLRRKARAGSFIGSGTKWHRYPELDSVPKFIAAKLAEVERIQKTAKTILR